MQWIRNISLVKRVTYGFGLMALVALALGATGIWALGALAAEFQQLAGPAGKGPLPSVAGLQWLLGSASVVGCVLSLVGGWMTRSSVKHSVEDTVQCVVRIAHGDLETKIESPGKDEISWLRHELNSMRKKLRTMVVEVRQTVDSVNTASSEIASGNIDLSARTERQASALQETASSMQQFNHIVKLNADSTMEASTLVAQSRDVATRGSTVMREAVERMGEILSSATRIGDIVGVIDGIAFQTNILALNAAVEAARAGEHGRGFAVVASEVRTLAQRSSTAAREIKALIGDSTSKVQAGSKLINDAGHTMQDLLDGVSRVSQLISDITQASQSQSSDIGHMSHAVQQLDTVTQQNAALVEEMSATAMALKEQSGRLSKSVGAFQVNA
ncbi:methyl-accepting chemotaxis protein [Ideonella sp. A 288]|uniref:methyl-accepting chemotaxis protein n=1 Tax=Ideonella sp. A 288 TaxID=1962181 RepID=UPI000B4AD56F|nr:methyl-accepting chemotaxis protein [Ideonella sp. A 288]